MKTRRWPAFSVASLNVALFCFGLYLFALPSHAHPDVWDLAKNPKLAETYKVWRAAERARYAVEPDYMDSDIEARLNLQCAVGIQMAQSKQLEDLRLLFLLGDCLVVAGQSHSAQGEAVLRHALSLHPKSPMAAGAWRSVALAAQRQGKHESVTEAASNALDLEWDPSFRSLILLRRGQSSMDHRDLPNAIEDFRAALETGGATELKAFARWSLAVALDRSYDLPAALPLARAAAADTFGPAGIMSAVELPWVELHPSEVYYFRALAQMSKAVELKGTPDYVSALQAAQLLWLSYVKSVGTQDVWLPRARQHLEHLRREVDSILGDDD